MNQLTTATSNGFHEHLRKSVIVYFFHFFIIIFFRKISNGCKTKYRKDVLGFEETSLETPSEKVRPMFSGSN